MTSNNIVQFEIEYKLRNDSSMFKPYKGASKKTICHGLNGDIYRSLDDRILLSIRPIQIQSAKSENTPVFAVFEDGKREQMDTEHFFSFLTHTPLIKVLVNLDEDELGDLFDEEREDRVDYIRLIVPADKFVESFKVNKEEVTTEKGNITCELSFLANEDNIKYIPKSEGYGIKHPQFRGIPDFKAAPKKPLKPRIKKASSKAAKSVISGILNVNSPMLKEEQEAFAKECEVIKVSPEPSKLEW